MWATKPIKDNDKYIIYDRYKKIAMPHAIQEIIEIGAIKIDEDLNVVSDFNTFVCPSYCPITKKCTQMTGITQNDVQGQKSIRKCLNQFFEWINCTGPDYQIYTWSESDRNQIFTECKTKKINTPLLDPLTKRYIDLQQVFSIICGRGKYQPVSLKNATELLNIPFEQYHRALEDAKVTGDVLTQIIKTWNNKLKGE